MVRSLNSVAGLVLTVCSIGLLGWYTGLLVPTAVASATAVAVFVTGLVGSRDELPTMALASVGYVIVATLSIATVAITFVFAIGPVGPGTSLPGLVSVGWQSLLFVVAVTLAALGAVSVPRQEALPAASHTVALTALVVTGVLAAATTVAAGLWLLETLPPVEAALEELEPAIEAVFASDERTPPLGSFLVLFALAGFATASALKALPITAFVARERREAVEAFIGRVRGKLLLVSVLSVLAGPLVLAVPEEVWFEVRDHEHVPPEGYDLLVSITSSGLLRGVLSRVVIASLVVLLTVWVLRRLRLEYVSGPARYLARGAGGFAVLGALLVVGPGTILERVYRETPAEAQPVIEEVVAEFGTFLPVVTVTFLVVTAVLVMISIVGLLGVFRIVPPRTASSVLGALGVGTASFAAGLLEGPSPILFVTVAVAIVVWDVGSYDRRLRAEIGDGATTRRAELTHTGASLAVAVCAGLGVYLVTTAVSLPTVDLASAGVASLLGTVLLLSVLRG